MDVQILVDFRAGVATLCYDGIRLPHLPLQECVDPTPV